MDINLKNLRQSAVNQLSIGLSNLSSLQNNLHKNILRFYSNIEIIQPIL
jgi:hypothetical protein